MCRFDPLTPRIHQIEPSANPPSIPRLIHRIGSSSSTSSVAVGQLIQCMVYILNIFTERPDFFNLTGIFGNMQKSL
ncbi:hypothetical protein I3842_16G105100 [Carya illinoinensis]|uniref:Uncharacterized protein n=1 Tax=Carya illinoinensis TaxID=32201 RepID=A0A922D9H3_CARIL|nr:hypothetical protein I3842_16G105100 [Carya illinoinensis]